MLGLVFGLIIFSCGKEKFDISNFGECSSGILTDSLALSTALTGTWHWTEKECHCCPACLCSKSSWVNKADKPVYATFNPDNTFTVAENDSIVISANWSVVKDTNGYKIALANQESSYHYFSGSVDICGNQLLAESFSGCKQLYIKNQ